MNSKKSNWYWGLVVPAFLAGVVVVPIVVHLAWDCGILILPPWDFLIWPIEIIKSFVGGACGVWFAIAAAPSHKRLTGISALALTCIGLLTLGLAFDTSVTGWLEDAYMWINLASTYVGAFVAFWFATKRYSPPEATA